MINVIHYNTIQYTSNTIIIIMITRHPTYCNTRSRNGYVLCIQLCFYESSLHIQLNHFNCNIFITGILVLANPGLYIMTS